MRDVLRKWTPQKNCVKYPPFPGTLWFVNVAGMFWRNFTTIRQIYIPYKFAQSGCFPPKIKCAILACKVHEQIVPRPEIITPNKTANQ